jgi:serine/threonine-protein kinase RsbT
MIRVEDMGPGIQNFEKKARGNASPGETTGLQHVDVLMDELRQIPIESGTCVEAVKWLKTSRMLSEKE